MEKHLLIIPCCATKIPGGKGKSNKLTYFENIEYVPDLISAREINIHNHPVVDAGKYMTAWDRYNGGLYTNLKAHQNLIDDLLKRGCLDIVIVSALYGVINYNTEINNYDLIMSQGGLSRLWDDHIIRSIQNYKLEMGVTHTHIALSNSYLNVANKNGGLGQITDLWVYGFRGVPLINRKVAEHIIRKLEEISEQCK